uniref:Protein transport protein sec16 n=1 Tax=Lepisosteus oculatus TaxID=7918 RepID=W5M6V3_LEPOC
MQPPPRTAPPGAVGPPPTGGVPNAFRRTKTYKPGNAPVSGAAAPIPPVTNPFAYGRQTPQTMALENHPAPMKSSPLPMQNQPPSGFYQMAPVQNQPLPSQTMESAQGSQSVPTLPSLSGPPGVNVFTPNRKDHGPFNSREHSPYHAQGAPDNSFEGPSFAAAPLQNRPPYVPSAMPFPPQNMQPLATQWMSDHGSRPPSVHNYFQPSSDHSSPSVSAPLPDLSTANIPQQIPPQSHVYSDQLGQSSQHNATLFPSSATSTTQQLLEKAESNKPPAPEHYNPQLPTQGYFSQNFGSPDPWFNPPPGEHFYHQMGGIVTNNLPNPANTEQAPIPVQSGELPAGNPVSYESDPGTLSMFFKGNDVENEEMLVSKGKTANGISNADSFVPSQDAFFNPGFPNTQLQSSQLQTGTDITQSSYLNDSGFARDSQKNIGTHFDNVENLECVPNQEVLPNEPPNIPEMPHNLGDNFEGGPNLETPDSIPHPVRSESVSSSYSNISHSSASSSRRPQGVVGTFIQQEIAKPTEETSAGYFEQIDTSPAGDVIDQNKMYHTQLSQPPTPSPPKPTGIFQASANSSFEPVRSHGVGVKPIEIDQARMVMEKSNGAQNNAPQGVVISDASPGNLEQPPDNLENIFIPSPRTPSVVQSHERRPSSRAHGTRVKCESPATTLWAQNEMPELGANILLAPAAPPVHGLFKQPSTEVIQPPEDGPLEHSFQQLQLSSDQASPSQKPETSSENLENPPKVTKDAQQTGKAQHEQQQLSTAAVPPMPTNTQQPADDTSQKPEAQPGLLRKEAALPAQPSQCPAPNNEYPQPQYAPGLGGPQPPSMYPPQPLPPNTSQQPPPDLQRPPSSHTPQPGYGPPSQPPQPPYGPYYGGAYPEYPDGRPYPPYPPPADPRAHQPYYQEDPYRRYDPRYGRYDNYNPAYREGERYQYPEQPERPSSRASQYSDRPSSRQGYAEDYYLKASRSAYDEYYADFYKKQYDYGASYDSRYRDYYDQSYWYNYDSEAYRRRDPYYSQAYLQRPEGYDDRWRYDPRYDASFDDEYVRPRDAYGDEYDRRSVHSEQSAHSVRSSRSQRSSFSSRSQQSQVYRSQQDLVGGSYDQAGQPTSLQADYSYRQYPDAVDGSQGYPDYQYSAGYQVESGWPAVEQAPPRPVTPEKYTVPHMCARFGPGGLLIKILPNLPSEGQPALVEMHSMETVLQDSQEQEELRSFPGPLVKEETHKVDVIKFAQNKAMECLRNESLLDKDSAFLIWEFIVLLCRQNGTVVGTDIADLLLREHKSVWLPGKSPNEANLIDFNNEPLEHAEEELGSGQLSLLSDTFMTVPENAGKETERFRELLLFGRKKDALESAMKNGLWGHALLLASKMDNRTHARVMTRFANSLPINDPLQTVYQLMSGRMPAAATCCGDEKWGDWRPHLAMVLSNLTHTLDLDTRTIATMGDTLASKGLIDAAHFCYIMAQVGLGVYTKKSTKMVLIGANHSLPFFRFASNEAIQRTEAYEYAQSLGSQPCYLPNFQVFKFIYACRLAEVGLSAQAFHYCEVISRTVLSHPSYYSPMFVSQLIQMSAKMRFFDPQLKEKPEQELFIEPDWLIQLRQLDGQIKDGAIMYSLDRATPQQYASSTPSSEFDQPSPPDGLGMSQDVNGAAPEIPPTTSFMPNPGSQVQLVPPAPPTILDGTMPSIMPPPAEGGVQFYPVPPVPLCPVPGPVPPSQGPGFPPPTPGYGVPNQQEQHEMYPGQHMPLQMPPSETLPTVPERQQNHQPGNIHLYTGTRYHGNYIDRSLVPPGGSHSSLPPQVLQPPLKKIDIHLNSQPSSPSRSTFTQGPMDFYDHMAIMGPGRRSRSTSQSSMHMGYGRRSRTTSESSSNSVGRDRSNSAAKQPSPPPPSIPEQPVSKSEDSKTATKKDSPKKGGGAGGWLNWLYRKRNEAYLPDDKNKSIVWDENKKRWVNLDEPEEESKPPPPPPTSFPKLTPQQRPGATAGPPSGAPPVNIFSRKAGTRSRYVDVLNPGGPKPSPIPADLFAPLAPMPIPTNLFIPSSASADSQQPTEGSVPETEQNTGQTISDTSSQPQFYNPGLYTPSTEGTSNTDATQAGEAPNQPHVQEGPIAGGVAFYNPSQFAQPTAPSGGARTGKFGQRKYPVLK